MDRLPKPDPIPTRPDEVWRVVPERYMEVVERGCICEDRKPGHSPCWRPAVAATTRSGSLVCETHLAESLMWVENGRVVSWCLVPVG